MSSAEPTDFQKLHFYPLFGARSYIDFKKICFYYQGGTHRFEILTTPLSSVDSLKIYLSFEQKSVKKRSLENDFPHLRQTVIKQSPNSADFNQCWFCVPPKKRTNWGFPVKHYETLFWRGMLDSNNITYHSSRRCSISKESLLVLNWPKWFPKWSG